MLRRYLHISGKYSPLLNFAGSSIQRLHNKSLHIPYQVVYSGPSFLRPVPVCMILRNGYKPQHTEGMHQCMLYRYDNPSLPYRLGTITIP
jgi:hypothetical protein